MKKAKRLTDASIKRVAIPEKGRVTVWDSHVPGFALRVSYSGRKTFELRYRIDGKQKRMTLGVWPAITLAEAREKARDAYNEVLRGDDPTFRQTERRREAVQRRKNTFGHVASEFVEKYARPSQKTWKETQYTLGRYVLPLWANRPVDTITRRDCIELVERVAEVNGPFAATHVRANVRKLFAWAVGRDVIALNPMADVPRPISNRSTERDRVLSDAEIKKVWSACDPVGFPFGAMTQLLLLTAQRLGEVSRMRWQDVDINDGVWHLSREMTKSDRSHDVPLSPEALRVLEGCPRFKDGDFIMTTRSGTKPVSGFSKAKRRLDQHSGVESWRFHDLRRTAATGLGNLGVERFIIERVLNHAQAGPTAVYDRARYMPQKRKALEMWGKSLLRLVSE